MNPVTKLDLKDLIQRYELSNRAEAKSPKTVLWYTEMLQLFSSYLSANHDACDLTSIDIEKVRDYILYLKQKQRFDGHPHTSKQASLLSPKTVQGHVRALKAFSSWLYSEGYTADNQLKNLKLPKVPITVMEPLTPKEIKKIIDSIDRKTHTGVRNNAIFVTLLDTGLRAYETTTITLENLNLTDGYIKVMGKGAKERIVPIGKYCYQ